MKSFYTLLLFTVYLGQLSAQDDKTVVSASERKGDKNFFNFAYATAIDFYMAALERDSTNGVVKLKVGDSYRMLNDPFNSTIWYEKGFTEVDDIKTIDPKFMLHYAQALSSTQDYEGAKKWFGEYKKIAKNESRATKRLEGLNNLSKFYEDSVYYQIKPVNINSKGLDFSPIWYDSGVVFVSSRTKSVFSKSVFNWDKSSYLDLYYSTATESGELGKPELFHKKVNTKYHEGPLSFYNNEQNVVFTRNNYNQGIARKSNDGITKLKLYFSERKEDGWGKITSFEYNDNEYSVGHPTITEDGKKMFFASDMPGGLGETDIYVTYFKNKKWSKPKNLGPIINTEGKEMFPYLNNGDLYFSSDGHEGLGGLDCYKTPLVNDQPLKVKNLGHPVNSSYDDFSLIITPDDRFGYFSSNRIDKVYDDIYYFLYTKGGEIYIRGKVIDDHYKIALPEATVSLLDDKGILLKDTLSDKNGDFEFKLQYRQTYTLAADKLGYHKVGNDSTITATEPNGFIENILLKLEPPHHVVSIIAINKNTLAMIPDALVSVANLKNNNLIEISKRGSHHHEFETKGGFSYSAKGTKTGFLSYSINIDIGFDHEYDTLFFEVPLEPIEIGKAIKLENIYYDLNKSFIRTDAGIELDKLVKILNENPTIEIELGSHTDSRGSDPYNKSLSQKRANSAVWYIVGKGISPSRIKGKGYGETALTNKCSNGVQCSKEQHQANRRTEFKVTKY